MFGLTPAAAARRGWRISRISCPLIVAEYNATARQERARRCPTRCGRRCRRTAGRATCASCATSSSAACCSPTATVFPVQWLQLPRHAAPARHVRQPRRRRRSRAIAWCLPLDGSMSLDDMDRHIVATAVARAARQPQRRRAHARHDPADVALSGEEVRDQGGRGVARPRSGVARSAGLRARGGAERCRATRACQTLAARSAALRRPRARRPALRTTSLPRRTRRASPSRRSGVHSTSMAVSASALAPSTTPLLAAVRRPRRWRTRRCAARRAAARSPIIGWIEGTSLLTLPMSVLPLMCSGGACSTRRPSCSRFAS